MAILSFSGFSHLPPGVFHITDTQNTAYTTEMVEENRTNKHGLGLSLSPQKEKFLTISMHQQATASVYFSEIHTKSPRMLTHLVMFDNPTWVLWPCSRSTADYPVFFPGLLLLTFGFPWLLSTDLFSALVSSAPRVSFPHPLPVS